MLSQLKIDIKIAFIPYLYYSFFRLKRFFWQQNLIYNLEINENLVYKRGWFYSQLDPAIKRDRILMNKFLQERDSYVGKVCRIRFAKADDEFFKWDMKTYDVRYTVWIKFFYLRCLFYRVCFWYIQYWWVLLRWFVQAVRIYIAFNNDTNITARTGWYYRHIELWVVDDPKFYRILLWKRRVRLKGFRKNLEWYVMEYERLMWIKVTLDAELAVLCD